MSATFKSVIDSVATVRELHARIVQLEIQLRYSCFHHKIPEQFRNSRRSAYESGFESGYKGPRYDGKPQCPYAQFWRQEAWLFGKRDGNLAMRRDLIKMAKLKSYQEICDELLELADATTPTRILSTRIKQLRTEAEKLGL